MTATKRAVLVALALAVSGLLLFSQLGSRALWDDEALTALYGLSVWQSGDASASLGQNIIAYDNGRELVDFKNRYVPPLMHFVAAPFVGLGGPTAGWARFPFALAGFAALLLLFRWLWKSGADAKFWIIFSVSLATNVQMILLMRQARHYSLALFFSVAIGYLYVMGRRRWAETWGLAALFPLLLFSNYLNYVALVGALTVDYVLWSRKKPFSSRQLLAIAGPQLVAVLAWMLVFDPLQKWSEGTPGYDIGLRLSLFWWNFRSLNSCEAVSGGVILGALAYAVRKRHTALIRAGLCAALYLFLVSALSPRPGPQLARQADLRYFLPIFPLLLGMQSAILGRIKRAWVLIPLLIVLLGSNAFHAAFAALAGPRAAWFDQKENRVRIRPTLAEYIGELIEPPTGPFEGAVQWIRENVPAGKSVLVYPFTANYPLMFHAPHAVYAWQLKDRSRAQGASLAPIHFEGEALPDYIVAFGPWTAMLTDPKLRRYSWVLDRLAVLPVYWSDGTRPELLTHRFREPESIDLGRQAVYVFAPRPTAP